MNYEMAKNLNELSDRDFYEVMAELGKMNNCYNIDDFIDWLKDVLYEISDTDGENEL